MKSRYKRLNGFLFALIYVAIYYVVAFAVSNIYYFWLLNAEKLSSSSASARLVNNTYVLTAVSWGICYCFYVLIGKTRKNPLENEIKREKNPPIIYAMVFSLAVGCRFLVMVYYSFAQNMASLKTSIEKAAQTTPEIVTTSQLLTALICVIMIGPLMEELLFRVLVMGELMRIMRPWAAITMQGIVFGVVHGVLFQSVFACAIGIILGVVYYKTRSLRVAVVCHSIFNFSALLGQRVLALREEILFLVVGLLLLSLSLSYIVNYSKRGTPD